MARVSTREKLLDCAEELFAEKGLGGVSLRAVNAAAGLSPAALHYHFGSGEQGGKQALVEALLGRRMPALMERRRQLLDAVERAPERPSARAVLDALVRPLAELLAETGEDGLRYLRFLHRLQSDGDLDPQLIVERYPGGVDRLLPLLRQALPTLRVSRVQLRMSLAIDILLQSLAAGPRLADRRLEMQVAALLDFLTGALEAPDLTDLQEPTSTPPEPPDARDAPTASQPGAIA